jgi:hypothetical protein
LVAVALAVVALAGGLFALSLHGGDGGGIETLWFGLPWTALALIALACGIGALAMPRKGPALVAASVAISGCLATLGAVTLVLSA